MEFDSTSKLILAIISACGAFAAVFLGLWQASRVRAVCWGNLVLLLMRSKNVLLLNYLEPTTDHEIPVDRQHERQR